MCLARQATSTNINVYKFFSVHHHLKDCLLISFFSSWLYLYGILRLNDFHYHHANGWSTLIGKILGIHQTILEAI